MKKFFNFECVECKHVENEYVDSSVDSTDCVKCDNMTKRTLSAPKCFQNTLGRSPSTSSRN